MPRTVAEARAEKRVRTPARVSLLLESTKTEGESLDNTTADVLTVEEDEHKPVDGMANDTDITTARTLAPRESDVVPTSKRELRLPGARNFLRRGKG